MQDQTTPRQAGTLTSLDIQKHDPKRVSLFIDGQFVMGLHVELVYEYRLQKGLFLTVETLESLQNADHLWRAKAMALDFLAYKPRTEQEVRSKLADQGFAEHTIEQVIERFRDLGYLNDTKFATHYSQSRLNHKGHGPHRIKQDLRRKGISTEDIKSAWEEVTEQGEDETAITALAEKRWQRLAGESSVQKRRKKLQDFLLRRGFPFDLVRRVVQRVEQADTSEDTES